MKVNKTVADAILGMALVRARLTTLDLPRVYITNTFQSGKKRHWVYAIKTPKTGSAYRVKLSPMMTGDEIRKWTTGFTTGSWTVLRGWKRP